MQNFKYVIKDELGIHARPAGMLVKAAKALDSKVTLNANGKSADATRLMAIMSMGVKKDCEVEVSVEGGDEATSLEAMKKFFEENL